VQDLVGLARHVQREPRVARSPSLGLETRFDDFEREPLVDAEARRLELPRDPIDHRVVAFVSGLAVEAVDENAVSSARCDWNVSYATRANRAVPLSRARCLVRRDRRSTEAASSSPARGAHPGSMLEVTLQLGAMSAARTRRGRRFR